MFVHAQTATYADNLRSTHNVFFCWKSNDHYLSLEDAEQLTDRRLQMLGTSTSSLEVHEEELKGELVAVKRFRHDEQHHPSLEDIRAALDKWKQVSFHPNISPFLGLCSDASRPLPMLVTPRACWNLLEYVETHPDAPKHALIYSMAAALEYMHGQEVPITHGNVKAGNVLVDRNGVAYLSDIGIFQAVTYRGRLTHMEEMRWSAPEKVLYQEEHTCACDTWSFAMTVIEMHTGLSPFAYYQLERVEIAINIGEIPSRPSNMTDDRLWNLVERCLKYAAINRPSMKWVARSLSLCR